MKEVLRIDQITKTFPGVRALDDVSFSINGGEIHALVGENGAGKSTLIKIISGAQKADSGSIWLDGKELRSITPASAKQSGIGVIYQEFSLVPSLTVLENLFLGVVDRHRLGPDTKARRKKALELFAQLGIEINPDVMVSSLSVAQQQIVEIARETSRNTKVMIMDEPTAALAFDEVNHLFKIIRTLKARGVTIIYISHRMDEIFELADSITILRDGHHVATKPMSELSRKDIITLMVGRELKESFPERNVVIGEPVLQLEDVSGNGDHNISFTLHKGEILGLAGLVGAGRTELAKVIVGAAKRTGGTILLGGKPVDFKTPGQAVDAGIALIPENRKTEGAFLDYTINWNIGIMALRRFSRHWIMDQSALSEQVLKLSHRLQIKTPSMEQLVRNLSGGNQQKVVVAKALAAETQIMIFDEPTRGIDVGSKQEIYLLMNQIVESGVSIIMISSEMEELIGMSDRMVVLHEGQQAGMLEKSEFTQQKILELASGIRGNNE
ncbi:MAG: sugar ABC transporter ATP-binding protein [Sphaerochaetaceae bacterium]|nr:sugar ABC transporter ATP-binding protein [Sphaerochaetaceae bacterium]